MTLSNADRQARFRKKEQLKRHADTIFRKCHLSAWNWRPKTLQNIRHSLDKAIQLPSGWTDDDYEQAERRLEQYYLDLISSTHQLENDLHENISPKEFMTTPDPAKLIHDMKADIENTYTLTSHIISALRISNCNEAAQAAALMEAMRFVGQSLAISHKVPCSKATAMCLASIAEHYDRPDWFAQKLARTLAQQIGEELARKVSQQLIKKRAHANRQCT